MSMSSPIGPDLEGEIWKPVPGYERYYQVSNMGRMRTTPRIVGTEAYNGYLQANMPGRFLGKFGSSRGRSRHRNTFRVPIHRIVAHVFLGPASKKAPEVNHLDGFKLNNKQTNLEYCNRSRNVQHAYDLGLIRRHNTHKLSDAQYKEIRRLYAKGGWTHETLAVQFGVSTVNIGYVLHRSPRLRHRSWKRGHLNG